MLQKTKGALCLRILILTAVCAVIALATWSGDIQQSAVSIFVACIIVATGILGTLFIWIFTSDELTSFPPGS